MELTRFVVERIEVLHCGCIWVFTDQAAEAVNWLKEMRRYFQPSLSMYSDAIGAVATVHCMNCCPSV
jgi:hypothetical protein